MTKRAPNLTALAQRLRGAMFAAVIGAAAIGSGANKPGDPPSSQAIAARAESPRSLDDLRAIESCVEDVARKVAPATVVVSALAGQGSGVIVSKDGYVLTAAHVTLQPGSGATIVLADGRIVRAKALGLDRTADAAMLKITDPGDYPFVELGASAPIKLGQFAVALGNPSERYQQGRPAFVRLGRIVQNNELMLQSDCTLEPGDSGGPLFDLQGKLIGINGAIGVTLDVNAHVPIDSFIADYDRLKNGEAFGLKVIGGGMLGIGVDERQDGLAITGVAENSPAEKAGVRAGDLLTQIGSTSIRSANDLATAMSRYAEGDTMKLLLQRDGRPLHILVKSGTVTTRPSKPVRADQTRQAEAMNNAFREALIGPAASTIRIRCDNKDAALGTIVGEDGYIVTSASIMKEPITCTLGEKNYPAKLVSRDEENDLALLKIDAAHLPVIAWANSMAPQTGQLVAVPSPQGMTLADGIVSVASLSVPRDAEEPDAPSSIFTLPDADKLPQYSPRTSGYPKVIQTDAIVRPIDCGGPLVDLAGKAIGITISRASRASTYAIPADVVAKFVETLKK